MIVFGAKEERLKVSIQLQSIMLKTTNQARNLGEVIASNLNFSSHIKTITKSAYYHLKNISRIKGIMFQQDLKKKMSMHLSLVEETTVTESGSYTSQYSVLCAGACVSRNSFYNTTVGL